MPAFRHGRNTRMYASAYEISDSLRQVGVTASSDTAETTAFGSTFKSYVLGMADGKLSVQGMFDATVDSTPFNAIFGSDGATPWGGAQVTSGWPATYCPEGRYGAANGGPPVSNNALRCWAMQVHETSYQVAGAVAEVVSIQAEFVSNAGIGSGILLQDNSSALTAFPYTTTNGANSTIATSTEGGWATIHCLAYGSSGGLGYTVNLQTSTTAGGTYTTRATANVINASGSQFLPITGTLDQYVKLNVTKDAATTVGTGITIVVALVRN